jgi:single-stranded-DNA-specific exonuclease
MSVTVLRQPGASCLRLLRDHSTLVDRLELDGHYCALAEPLADLLAAEPGWLPIEDFLRRIVRERSATLLYGDYDVDGCCATFLLFRWLRGQGVPCNYFLPSRFKHGYGLHSEVIVQAKAQGYANLIALDCGTTNVAEIALAREQGLQVAVIDHHKPDTTLPDALILNPYLHTSLPPLCTAGMVYAVLRRMEQLGSEHPAPDALEIAGLATIADIVPFVPHNWALARQALARLPQTANVGLSELCKASRLDGLDTYTSRQAAFNLVPRLNAAGRMHSARLAVDLLGAVDRTAARNAVLRLDTLNNERRDITDRITAQAIQQALSLGTPAALALYDAHWHPGVIGIVASRVAEQLDRPTVILCDAPAGDGLLMGSARAGKPSVDILALLHDCDGCILSAGGHAQAAGVKLKLDCLPEFRLALASATEAAANSATATLPTESAREEQLSIQLPDLTAALEEDLWLLSPFGPGWLTPRCVIHGCEVVRTSYMGADRTHMNLLVTDRNVQVRIAGFKQSHLVHQLKPGQAVRPLVEIEPDNWNNRQTIMLRLLALS